MNKLERYMENILESMEYCHDVTPESIEIVVNLIGEITWSIDENKKRVKKGIGLDYYEWAFYLSDEKYRSDYLNKIEIIQSKWLDCIKPDYEVELNQLESMVQNSIIDLFEGLSNAKEWRDLNNNSLSSEKKPLSPLTLGAIKYVYDCIVNKWDHGKETTKGSAKEYGKTSNEGSFYVTVNRWRPNHSRQQINAIKYLVYLLNEYDDDSLQYKLIKEDLVFAKAKKQSF